MSIYKPTWVTDNIYNISATHLKERNIEAVLTDLDNTLITWDNPSGTKELKRWVKEMKDAEIPVIVVSNNTSKRVSAAIKHLNIPFETSSGKPLPFGVKRALKKINIHPNKVILVGDQILTDILSAKLAGIKSILVEPLVKSDAWYTKPNRFVERFIRKQIIEDPTLRWLGENNHE